MCFSIYSLIKQRLLFPKQSSSSGFWPVYDQNLTFSVMKITISIFTIPWSIPRLAAKLILASMMQEKCSVSICSSKKKCWFSTRSPHWTKILTSPLKKQMSHHPKLGWWSKYSKYEMFSIVWPYAVYWLVDMYPPNNQSEKGLIYPISQVQCGAPKR